MAPRLSPSTSISSIAVTSCIESRDYALAIVQTVREPLVVLDGDCRVGLANEAFYRLFDETARRSEGRFIWDTGAGVWSELALRRLAARRLPGQEKHRRTWRSIGCCRRTVLRILVLNARAIRRGGGRRCCCSPSTTCTDSRQAECVAHRCRDAASDRSPQGRVSRHPRARVAQSAGADAFRARRSCVGPRATRRREARATGARAAGRAHGSYRRRSARRLTDHARQGRAPQGSAAARRSSSRRPSSCPGRPSTRRSHMLTVSLPDRGR